MSISPALYMSVVWMLEERSWWRMEQGAKKNEERILKKRDEAKYFQFVVHLAVIVGSND